MKNLKKILVFIIWLIILFPNNINANQIKILVKINDELITNVDVENEYKYLSALNESLKDLKKEKILKFAKDSLIREKVKKNEILKYYELNQKNETVDLMIEKIYQDLNINSLKEFKDYLNRSNLDFEEIKKKIEIETVWNQMIYTKYKDKILINEDELKKKIIKNQNENEFFLLYEIVFEFENKDKTDIKYNEIIKYINNEGFQNAVIQFSISESKKNSGLIGWVNKNGLSGKIRKELDKLQIGEITKPIILPSGVLILKLQNKKLEKIEIDVDVELKKLFEFEMNNQLNNFSSIYYNKIKDNFSIKEYE